MLTESEFFSLVQKHSNESNTTECPSCGRCIVVEPSDLILARNFCLVSGDVVGDFVTSCPCCKHDITVDATWSLRSVKAVD